MQYYLVYTWNERTIEQLPTPKLSWLLIVKVFIYEQKPRGEEVLIDL